MEKNDVCDIGPCRKPRAGVYRMYTTEFDIPLCAEHLEKFKHYQATNRLAGSTEDQRK